MNDDIRRFAQSLSSRSLFAALHTAASRDRIGETRKHVRQRRANATVLRGTRLCAFASFASSSSSRTHRDERQKSSLLTQSSSRSFRRARAQEEKRKAVFNEVVAKLTDTCFEKCVTYAPGAKFSSSEASCLTNCALRYLESGRVVLERLQGGR